MTDAPRDSLIRANFAQRAAMDGRTMVGYPIVFEKWTEIESWEGRFRERIGANALDKTLRESGDKVKVLFNHGYDPQIGDKPLGKPSRMEPDSRGLDTITPLSDTSYNNDLIALMNDGAIDGMSFRFSVVKEEWDKEETRLPERTITELKLYEFGPVTFPAYQATTVGIRSRENLNAWLGLDDEQRNSIAHIVGIDLCTLDAAGTATVDRAAQELNDSEPQGVHSGVPQFMIRRADGVTDWLRSFTNGSTRTVET